MQRDLKIPSLPTSPKLFAPVNLARLLLVVLPGVPGLIFLAVGLVRDPRWSDPKSGDALRPGQVRAAEQARGLYLVGAVTLVAGTVGMAAVGWKIARTRPEEVDVSPEAGQS